MITNNNDKNIPLAKLERHSSYNFRRSEFDLEMVGPVKLTFLEELEIKYSEKIGLYYMIASVSFMSLNALFVKLCSNLPVFELVFLRSIMTFILLYVYVNKFSPNLEIDDKKNKKYILILIFTGFFVAVTYVYGIFTLDLAEAVTVSFTTPMWLGLFSWIIFGQEFRPNELYCVALVLVGVLCIMRPDFNSSNDTKEQILENQSRFYGVIACLIHSFFNAGNTMIAKSMTTGLHPIVVMIFGTIINFLFSGLVSLITGWKAPSGDEWIHLIIMTFLYFGGQFFLMKSIQKSDKTSNTPIILSYGQLPLAYFFDILVFGTTPLGWSVIGTVAVMVGSIAIVKIR